ncbi:membrane-bound O-acyltransferase gup1-like [Triticum urartu]|uniref:Membrane-bound O-acyltransferase C24H6.01c n=1 Tax=Triticum urartu TaxID=4572 RepID=A0A8R7VG30_TRIUA|nr:membrane-bound O-acyltransferase gup1-like [Triticum urartu]XP_048568199.1 membrane-bound O-acyltransferase gup1-like [Triticum urartu]
MTVPGSPVSPGASKMSSVPWKRLELAALCAYAVVFYSAMVQRSLRLARDYSGKLYGLRAGSIPGRLNDSSDAQWRNFRGNLPILTVVMAAFLIVANGLRYGCSLKGRGASLVWLILSLIYLCYLHGACVGFILVIAGVNYAIVKLFARYKYCTGIIWSFNLAMLTLNRVYEGYSFSLFGQQLAFLDNYRGTFRWHICFNFVVLRMISFGCDYCWTLSSSHFDHKKHMQKCEVCYSGKTCYFALQEKGLSVDKYTFLTYLCYLTYAPLYIAGPVVSYNAFAAQLDVPQKNYSVGQICCYGLRWILNFLLIEVMTHFFHYNAFVVSRLWRQLTPFEIFIISYGVLFFMWLKFFLIWRYFRFWSLVGGVETPENMPRCINNCPDLESFWKSWHASFNRWLVRYVYIPLGGSRRKLISVWIVFTFVAVWHDLEWKLISWAWLTCLFFVPEIVIKSFSNNFQAKSTLGRFIHRELCVIAGAVTVSSLMVANLVGYVVGPSGIKVLMSRMLHKDALPALGIIFSTFYVGVKLIFHIRDARKT